MTDFTSYLNIFISLAIAAYILSAYVSIYFRSKPYASNIKEHIMVVVASIFWPIIGIGAYIYDAYKYLLSKNSQEREDE